MTPEDRSAITQWLTLHLVHAEGAYTPAARVQQALYEDTRIFASITFLGHQIQAQRAQGDGYGTIYLDRTLHP